MRKQKCEARYRLSPAQQAGPELISIVFGHWAVRGFATRIPDREKGLFAAQISSLVAHNGSLAQIFACLLREQDERSFLFKFIERDSESVPGTPNTNKFTPGCFSVF